MHTINYAHLVVVPEDNEINHYVDFNSHQGVTLSNDTSSQQPEQISLSGNDVHCLGSTVIGSRPGRSVCKARGNKFFGQQCVAPLEAWGTRRLPRPLP